MQYFAQDEATRLDPALTVYETLSAGSPMHMVPAIRNILGGFLFAGDDVYKKAGVLSGGERTRLAVARMLLRPSNTLVLDEPTNHLDLESKDVLLDALEDYGGTLLFVSHDRYFVERLATKMVEVGQAAGRAVPGHLSPSSCGARRRARAPPPARCAGDAEGREGRRRAARPPPPPSSRSDRAAEHEARQARRRRSEEAGARLPGAVGDGSPTSRAASPSARRR